ncbi:hypothetical protein QQF64_007821 [Cirrhinus molitorella]|uniref:Uncharacterized protein n=1 Tax=Cirrhinus molitorella TaxID=172907 RepID=A0ABR3M7V0_9TELE
MLLSLEGPTLRGMELNCCSHVDFLLSKMPKFVRDGFIEYLQLQGKFNSPSINVFNLQDFAGLLQVIAQQQRLSSSQSTALYNGTASPEVTASLSPQVSRKMTTPKINCLFCGSRDHYITRCSSIKEQNPAVTVVVFTSKYFMVWPKVTQPAHHRLPLRAVSTFYLPFRQAEFF